jgi:hypothetical protein
MNEQITRDALGSITAAWLRADIAMSKDGGHSYEYREGLHIVDGMVSCKSYASARELMGEAT